MRPGVVVSGGGQFHRRFGPSGAPHLEETIGPERGDDSAAPRRIGGQGPMGRQLADRVVGGGQDLEPEPVVERPRPHPGRRQALGDGVVQSVGGGGRRPGAHPEDVDEFGLQPRPHGRSGEHVPMGAERPPGRAGTSLVEIAPTDPEVLEGHATGVEQAGHVVVGGDQQRRRIGERGVVDQQGGIDVTVRGQERCVGHRGVEATGHRPRRRVRREQAVRMQDELGSAGHAPVCPSAADRVPIPVGPGGSASVAAQGP